MKWTRTFLLTLIFATSGFIASAQTLQTLFSFNANNGSRPNGLTLGNDGNFYGTTEEGGMTNSGGGQGYGTVFQVTTNGALATLFSFNFNNGAWPQAGLTLGNDGDFYGTIADHTGQDDGTVFQVTTNGSLATVGSFNLSGSNGDDLIAALTLGNDGNFYGTAGQGGANNYGTVFQVTTNGTLTTLVSFNATNGRNANALTLGNDGNFYGTTHIGVSGNFGTIFKVTTNGALTTLASFNGTNGANPNALTLGNDGNFYGTTEQGGNFNGGTVFQITTNGALTTLISFNGTNGSFPQAALTLGNDGNFYGTTYYGGGTNLGFGSSYGTIFKVTTNGMLTTLFFFNVTNGANPSALTLGSDGNFYGTTYYGGNTNVSNGYGYGYGTVFRLVLPQVVTPTIIPPTLTLQFLAGYPLLSMYGTLSNTYTVEYTTNLAIPNWTPLLIVPNLSISPFQMIDSAGVGQPARFYRAFME